MDMLQYFFGIILAISIANVEGDCDLSLKSDFLKPAPVYIRDGHFLGPNITGDISLRKSETLLVGCPGSKRHVNLGTVSTPYDVVEAQCITKTTFQVDNWIGPFKNIKCNIQPYYTAEEDKKGCGRGYKLYNVGYRLIDQFYTQYKACFDPDLVHTVYVQHEIKPSNVHYQKETHRPSFTEGDLFPDVKMTEIYTIKHQKERINELLGPNAADKFVSRKQFLSKGHLAARADFSLRAEQVASFHYVNTVPQWQRGNAGDWAALEEALKRRVHTLGRPVTVYTGSYEVLSFENGVKLFLTTDANNNGIVPVPLYLYKLVYDPKTHKAVVFISINATFYNSTMIDQLMICEDVCERKEYSWLTWRDDGTTSFCCAYEDAQKLDLPRLPVSGLFY